MKDGKIKATKLPNGQYDYDETSVYAFLNKDVKRKTYLYTRVNSKYHQQIQGGPDKMFSKFAEIRSNYVDEDDDITYIDAWLTTNDNEEGTVIAKINNKTKEIEYLDPDARTDNYAQEIIQQVITELC